VHPALCQSQQHPGWSAAAAAENLTRKYADIASGVDFSPFAIETSKVWGEHTLELVTLIGRNQPACSDHTVANPEESMQLPVMWDSTVINTLAEFHLCSNFASP